MQKHCEEYVRKHGPVRIGQVAHTKAGGNLKCEWIIHCVTTSTALAQETENPKLKAELDRIMRELFTNLLHKAEKLKVRSLAFPPAGGHMLDQYSAGKSAEVIIDTLLRYKYQSSSLCDIRLVTGSDTIFDTFVDLFLKRSVQLTSQHYQALSQGERSQQANPSSCKQQ